MTEAVRNIKKTCSFPPIKAAGVSGFPFVKIPKIMFSDENLKCLPVEAKVLYAVMLDRKSLSLQNHWVDDGLAYICLTQVAAAIMLGCGRGKISRAYRELEEKGLIRKKKMRVKTPDRIFIKNILDDGGDCSKDMAYLRFPKEFFSNELFQELSLNAMLLYVLMLDRMHLSIQSKDWEDALGYYITFAVAEAVQFLNCSPNTAKIAFGELESFGLIRRSSRGVGCTPRIYVRDFSSSIENNSSGSSNDSENIYTFPGVVHEEDTSPETHNNTAEEYSARQNDQPDDDSVEGDVQPAENDRDAGVQIWNITGSNLEHQASKFGTSQGQIWNTNKTDLNINNKRKNDPSKRGLAQRCAGLLSPRCSVLTSRAHAHAHACAREMNSVCSAGLEFDRQPSADSDTAQPTVSQTAKTISMPTNDEGCESLGGTLIFDLDIEAELEVEYQKWLNTRSDFPEDTLDASDHAPESAQNAACGQISSCRSLDVSGVCARSEGLQGWSEGVCGPESSQDGVCGRLGCETVWNALEQEGRSQDALGGSEGRFDHGFDIHEAESAFAGDPRPESWFDEMDSSVVEMADPYACPPPEDRDAPPHSIWDGQLPYDEEELSAIDRGMHMEAHDEKSNIFCDGQGVEEPAEWWIDELSKYWELCALDGRPFDCTSDGAEDYSCFDLFDDGGEYVPSSKSELGMLPAGECAAQAAGVPAESSVVCVPTQAMPSVCRREELTACAGSEEGFGGEMDCPNLVEGFSGAWATIIADFLDSHEKIEPDYDDDIGDSVESQESVALEDEEEYDDYDDLTYPWDWSCPASRPDDSPEGKERPAEDQDPPVENQDFHDAPAETTDSCAAMPCSAELQCSPDELYPDEGSYAIVVLPYLAAGSFLFWTMLSLADGGRSAGDSDTPPCAPIYVGDQVHHGSGSGFEKPSVGVSPGIPVPRLRWGRIQHPSAGMAYCRSLL